MSKIKNSKYSGYLFMMSGAIFFATAVISEQKSYFGIGVMFICLGLAFIRKNS